MKLIGTDVVVGRGYDLANAIGGAWLKAIFQERGEFILLLVSVGIVLVLVSLVAAWEIDQDLPFQNAEYATVAN